MSEKDSRIDRVERAMAAVHGQPATVDVGASWQQDVMRDVRRAHAARQENAFVFGEYLLRWAAVVSTAAVFFAVYTLGTGWDPSAELVRVWTDDPAGFTTAALLGF
ncbi:MAG: hypothetical protein V1929_11525 [bacterium]